MKKLKLLLFTVSFIVLFFSISILIYGDSDGRTGRTKKTSNSGCGSCHGSAAVTDVSVILTGPDTVIVGQTKQFSLTISKPSKTGAGLDVATRRGVLAPVSSNIHLSGGELTQNENIPLSGGTVSVLFNYTAPATPASDTLWATGLVTNSNGGTSGDDWNWSISKRIIVKLATGISKINSLVNDFDLNQNYPNPFNPSTKIKFTIPASEGKLNSDLVSLKIYNNSGIEIYSMTEQKLSPGTYSFEWNSTDKSGKNVSSGVYFCKLSSGNFSKTIKMLLIK